MKRVYFNSIIKQGSTYELEKKYYIHLVKVIRLKIGDEISLFNNISGEWKCEIIDLKKKFFKSEIDKSNLSTSSRNFDRLNVFSHKIPKQ